MMELTLDDFLRYLKEIGHQHLSPDVFYQPGSKTFIYTRDGDFVYDDYPATHSTLVSRLSMGIATDYHFDDYSILEGRIAPKDVVYVTLRNNAFQDWLHDNNLKVGSDFFDFNIVCFWNRSKHVADLVQGSLGLLLKKKLISPEDVVSTFFGLVGLVGSVVSGTTKSLTKTVDPEMQQKIDLWRKLHLMRGDEKKQAMQTLKLNPGGNKNKWQNALEKKGHLTPGQKWWAPHSESFSFRQWLNRHE